jgi:hypothetical protein
LRHFVFLAVAICRRWRSKPLVASRFLGNLHLGTVYHFSRFVFLHQLQHFLRLVSLTARRLRRWLSNTVVR